MCYLPVPVAGNPDADKEDDEKHDPAENERLLDSQLPYVQPEKHLYSNQLQAFRTYLPRAKSSFSY
jgi:hypothetical protein